MEQRKIKDWCFMPLLTRNGQDPYKAMFNNCLYFSIIIHHVIYILKINKLKQDQKEKRSLEEYFIKLDEKPQY